MTVSATRAHRRHQLASLATLFVSFAAGACSDAGSPATVQSTTLTSSGVYDQIVTAIAHTDASVMRATPTASYYAQLLAQSDDAPVPIADLGVNLRGLHSQLVTRAAFFKQLSRDYPTLGDLIDAGLVALPHAAGLRSFQAHLLQLKGEAAASALYLADLQGTKSVSIGPATYLPPGALYAQQRTYYDPSGKEMFSCDIALNVAHGLTPYRLEVSHDIAKRGAWDPEVTKGVYALSGYNTDPDPKVRVESRSGMAAIAAVATYEWTLIPDRAKDANCSLFVPANTATE